jgi:hypothetical protein
MVKLYLLNPSLVFTRVVASVLGAVVVDGSEFKVMISILFIYLEFDGGYPKGYCARLPYFEEDILKWSLYIDFSILNIEMGCKYLFFL